MNRSSMRAVLRRRVQDTGAVGEWSDAELNELLNLALLDIETAVLAIDPDAFTSIDTFDIVSGQQRYDKPAGFLYEYELGILDSSYATGYRPLERRSLNATRARSSTAAVEYASLGRFFWLTPTPSANLDEGLQLIWTYSLSMSDDNDVPLIVLPLHDAVVDMALVKAFAEGADQQAEDRAQARVDRALASLPLYYRRSRVSGAIEPAVRDAIRSQRVARDVYP